MTMPEGAPEHSPPPVEAGPLPASATGFVVGAGEDPFLGDGWHPREVRQTDGIPYRGIAPRATFRLRRPVGEGARLTILLTAPVPMLAGPYQGELRLDGQVLGRITLESDSWAVRRFDLPSGSGAGDEASFELRSETSFVPAERIEGSRDTRRIACYVAAVLSSACGQEPMSLGPEAGA